MQITLCPGLNVPGLPPLLLTKPSPDRTGPLLVVQPVNLRLQFRQVLHQPGLCWYTNRTFSSGDKRQRWTAHPAYSHKDIRNYMQD